MRRRGNGRRGLVAETAALAGVALLGIGMYLWSANARTRNEAQKQQWELANQAMNSNAPNAAVDALQSFKQTQMQNLRGVTAEGAGNMAPAALGPLGAGADIIQNTYQAGEALGDLAQEAYGRPSANAAEAELIRAQGNAAHALARKTAPEVANLRGLHAQIVRRYQQYKGMSAAGLAEARRLNPRWQNLSGNDLIGAMVQRDAKVLTGQAKAAYEEAQWQLKKTGKEPKPEEILEVVNQLFRGKGGQLNEEGFKAALAAAVAGLQLDGTYTGNYSGAGSGRVTLTIMGTSVQGGFTGVHNKVGGGSVNILATGSYDRVTGAVRGRLAGTVTGLLGAAYPATGSFRGQLSNGKINGTWQASSQEEPASGAFSVSK